MPATMSSGCTAYPTMSSHGIGAGTGGASAAAAGTVGGAEVGARGPGPNATNPAAAAQPATAVRHFQSRRRSTRAG